MRIDLDTETADSIRVKRSSGSKKEDSRVYKIYTLSIPLQSMTQLDLLK
jgi:hypothetical protein